MNLRFSDMLNSARIAMRRAALVVPAALLAMTLAATPAMAAEGEPAILYDGATNELTVNGAYDGSQGPDLFTSFKGLVPGDRITQEIPLEFSNISAGTRLFIQADTSQLSDDAIAALSNMTLTVSFEGDGAFESVPVDAPQEVFAGQDPVHVATFNEPSQATMKLTLYIDPWKAGNELAELGEVTIPWVIQIQEDDGDSDDNEGPISTALTPHASDLVAYEGGMGTDASGNSVGNALPDPEWVNADWDSARVTVANQVWDESNPYWSQGTDGLPFRWVYGSTATDPVTASARVGEYHLMVYPLFDANGEPLVVTVNGKLLVLGDATTETPDGSGYVVTTTDGSDTMVQVREVTDNTAADALATSHFKNVYGEVTAGQALNRALSDAFGGIVTTAFAAPGDSLQSALDGQFTASGTHAGDCDSTVAHAHVAAGTTFVKNGNLDMPVNDDARIGLLWDDFIAGVLGEPEREGVLDDKARAAVGGSFATGEGVQRRFKYLDLVDMNDGNLWVSTADQSSVTIFVPYFEGISSEDTIAVAYFDGLTRDYTLALGQADLDAEIAGTTAHAVKVTKAADGIFFEVPWAEFGPFELMWIDADAGEGPGGDTGQQPGDTGQQPGGDTGNIADDQTDKPHGQLVQTGDYTLMIAGGIAVLALVAIVVGVVLARRKREQ